MANENLTWELQKAELVASFRELADAIENGRTLPEVKGALRELCGGLGMFTGSPDNFGRVA